MIFFVMGLLGTALILCKPAGHRAWLLADLIWVVLGGFGALVAVVAGIYKADSSRIDRQIDIAYAATSDFDRDAARFRLTHCETSDIKTILALCDKVDFLSASTAGNAELPLFIAITGKVSPLKSLNFFFGKADEDIDAMMDTADDFNTAQFLAFTTLDDPTRRAMEAVRVTRPDIAADFQILAQSYDQLIDQVSKLKTEWEYLQNNSHILILQIVALCLVSFAAPFRLGKSISELRAPRAA